MSSQTPIKIQHQHEQPLIPNPSHTEFINYLVALFSAYELVSASNPPSIAAKGRLPVPIPRYDGAKSWESDSILRSLEVIFPQTGDLTGNGHSSGGKDVKESFLKSHGGIKRDNTNDINLGELPPSRPPSSLPTPAYQPLSSHNGSSVPSALSASTIKCPTCGSLLSSSSLFSTASSSSATSPSITSTLTPPSALASSSSSPSGMGPNGPFSSPLGVIDSTGPLAHAAFESGLSAIEELKLLKSHVLDVSRVCNAVASGDLSQKIEVDVQGSVMIQLKDVINSMVDKLSQFASEVTRVSVEVGTEGKLGGQAVVVNVEGTWKELAKVVHTSANNLTNQVRSIA